MVDSDANLFLSPIHEVSMTLAEAIATAESLTDEFLAMNCIHREEFGDGITEYVVTCHPTQTPTAERGIQTATSTYYLWNRVMPSLADGSQTEELEMCGVTFPSLKAATAEIERRRARHHAAAVDRITDRIEDMRHRNYESGDPYGEEEW